MTAQIMDTVFFGGDEYDVVGTTSVQTGSSGKLNSHAGIVSPKRFGMMPVKMHTACYRGFYAAYEITLESMYLRRLTVKNIFCFYPSIKGVKPVRKIEDCDDMEDTNVFIRPFVKTCLAVFAKASYDSLNVNIPYTGTILLAKDFIDEFHVNMGFQKPTAYKTVLEVVLKNGKISGVSDRSQEMQQQQGAFFKDYKTGKKSVEDAFSLDIKAELTSEVTAEIKMSKDVQRELQLFRSKNWMTEEWENKVGILNDKAINQLFELRAQPIKVDSIHETMLEIKSSQCKPIWFISSYIDYYERQHQYHYEFSHLKLFGCPDDVIEFLKTLITPEVNQEKIIAAFLESLKSVFGDDIWGETLGIIIGRQFKQDALDPLICEKISKKLSRTTLEVW